MKPEKKAGELFLSAEIYCEEAVQLAAAVFEGRGVRAVKAPGGTRVEAADPAAALAFCNEALNQQCRLDLSRKNFKIASLIATKALLSAAGEKAAKRE